MGNFLPMLLSGMTGAVIGYLIASILRRKTLTQDGYEREIDLKDEKINALLYDNERLEQLAKSRLEAVVDLRAKLKFKDAVNKTLLADIKFAKDSGKLEIIKELTKC